MNEPNNFCVLPWIHLETSANGFARPCCIYSGHYKNSDNSNVSMQDTSITQAMNSYGAEQIRKAFRTNVKPDGCKLCWDIESAGGKSKRLESNEKYMKKIRWEKVDRLIFVNPELEKIFKQKINKFVKTVTIPNAIDIEKFDYFEPSSKNSLLAYSHSFHPVKGYNNLLTTFAKIINANPNFSLTIAAKKPTSLIHIKNYNECKKIILNSNLKNKAFLHEITEDKEIPTLLKNHNGIISYSDIESFHYSFAEGLLSGLQGFCNGWRKLNPNNFWNTWCYKNEQKFVEGILQWGELSLSERKKISSLNRKYIIENFSSKKIGQEYLNLLASL